MRVPDNQNVMQIQFWALIGPFLALVTLFILLLRASVDNLVLPVLALTGTLVSWRWKGKGLAVALGALGAVLMYQYTEIPIEERFWHMGLGMAIALGFVITALSYEEVETIVKGIHEESSNRLEHLWQMDERLKGVEQGRRELADQLRSQAEELHCIKRDGRHKEREHEELVGMARSEVLDFGREIERLGRESAELRQQVAKLEEALDDSRVSEKALLLRLKDLSVKKEQVVQNEELVQELMDRIELLQHRNEVLEKAVSSINIE